MLSQESSTTSASSFLASLSQRIHAKMVGDFNSRDYLYSDDIIPGDKIQLSISVNIFFIENFIVVFFIPSKNRITIEFHRPKIHFNISHFYSASFLQLKLLQSLFPRFRTHTKKRAEQEQRIVSFEY